MSSFSFFSRKKISITEFPKSLNVFLESYNRELQKLKIKQEELEREFVEELNKSHYDTSRQVIEKKRELLGKILDIEVVIEFLEIIQLNMDELVKIVSNSSQKEAKFQSFVNDIFNKKKIHSFQIRNLILKKLSKILGRDLEIKGSEAGALSTQEKAILNNESKRTIERKEKTDEIDNIIAEVKERMKKK